MSVMLLNKKQFERVFASIYMPHQNRDFTFLKNELLGDWDQHKTLFKQIEALYKANHISYVERYSHYEDIKNITLEPLQIESCLEAKSYDNYSQLLKSLQCIRYNIEEIFNFEKLKYEYPIDMTFIDTLINGLKDVIIYSLEEYNRAVWTD